MKKLVLLIVFFVILIIIFILSSYLPKNYTYKYYINNYHISETYHKDDAYYEFHINEDGDEYILSFASKYYRKRGIIKAIDTKLNCFNIAFFYKIKKTVCKKDDVYVTNFYNKNIESNVKDKYENIDIYHLLDNKYLIWNYNGFVFVTNKIKKNIELFDNDIYELKLISKIDRYLLVADYNQKYRFNKFFLIDSKNGNVKEIKIDRYVYFDSYILGVNKKSIYLFDNNADIEYVFNPYKNTISKHNYEILENGKWQKISLNKLKKFDILFSNDELYYYEIKDSKLYYTTPINSILVTDLNVSRIVESNSKTAYFISEDSLYYVDIDNKAVKLMTYSEWQFNNSNIYIF